MKTSGPASLGVWPERARTTPMLTDPDPPLTGSRSASKVAHSNLTPGAPGTPASALTFDVQSRHDRSFLGAAIGGGPLGGGFVVATPGFGRRSWSRSAGRRQDRDATGQHRGHRHQDHGGRDVPTHAHHSSGNRS